jgi:hypothetical protein
MLLFTEFVIELFFRAYEDIGWLLLVIPAIFVSGLMWTLQTGGDGLFDLMWWSAGLIGYLIGAAYIWNDGGEEERRAFQIWERDVAGKIKTV